MNYRGRTFFAQLIWSRFGGALFGVALPANR